MAERQLPKLNVAGSIPVSRSKLSTAALRRSYEQFQFCRLACTYRFAECSWKFMILLS